MKQFFKYTLASMLGLFLSWILFFVFIAIIAASGDDEEVIIEDNSVLKIKMSMNISDFDSGDDFASLPIPGLDNSKSVALVKILDNIEKAKKDSKIKGIVLTDVVSNQGSAQLQELRVKLLEFKESGKFIYAYSDFYNQKGYWVSTVADSIFVNPFGSIEFKGVAAEIMFFKDFQDKFGIKYDVIRHGKFKSAVEPFLENKISEANRTQTKALIDAIWNTISSDVSSSRNIPEEKLQEFANKRLADDSRNAVEIGLADVLAYQDEFENFIADKLNTNVKDINVVKLSKYFNSIDENPKEYSRDRIAVLYAEGEITYRSDDLSGENIDVNLVDAIREISDDSNIKGLVLRVNSPGGSALTSEIIWRELKLLQEKIPVYVSMGNYAASGGYYIASASDKIYADNTTITGSIGVFGMIPNAQEAANNLGIRSDVVSTNDMSFEFSLAQGANSQMKAKILEGVEKTYNIFVSRVSENRNMTYEQVDNIGQGRVWAASDAKQIGLIDEIGGLNKTIEDLALSLDLDKYRIVSYPEIEDELTQIIRKLKGEVRTKFIKGELGDELYEVIEQLKIPNSKGEIQASMPFELKIY